MNAQGSSTGKSPNDNGDRVTYFGLTDSRGKKVRFGIKEKDRSKHMYVIGKTGMGKSTLLENMAIQDIQNGEGVAFIDPHGGTAEKLLEYVPEHRVKDVLYFAPFDMEYPISFNVMEDIGMDKRHLVVNGLMSTFEKIWVDAWSARMAYILNNTLLALLEYPGSTLLGVNRMLADKEYRKKIVDNITDPSVRSFWVDEFAKYTERFAAEATPAIQNKVGQFTSNPLVRNIIGQSRSSFDLREIMDNKKILIINLSKGRVGEGNANLLGSMLITKIYLAAMSRADASPAVLNKLPNFFLYVDEFQSFANKSFADILSEARKYKLNLTIAHQYVEQMEEEVRDAVFGNVGTTIAFRVGPFDAEVLETVFAPHFTAENLVNLGLRQIYLTLMIDGVGSRPFSATTMPPIEAPEISYRDVIIANSRKTFGTPRAQVEEEIKTWHGTPMATGSISSGSKKGETNGEVFSSKPSVEKPPNRITVRADGTRIIDSPKNMPVVDKQISAVGTLVATSIELNPKTVPQIINKSLSFKTPATTLPRINPQNQVVGGTPKTPLSMDVATSPTSNVPWSVLPMSSASTNDQDEFKRQRTSPQMQYTRDPDQPQRKNKGPTDKNLSSLRDALKSVMSQVSRTTTPHVGNTASPVPQTESVTNSLIPTHGEKKGEILQKSILENIPSTITTPLVSLKDALLAAQKENLTSVKKNEEQKIMEKNMQVEAKTKESMERPQALGSNLTMEKVQEVSKGIKEIPEAELKKILDIE